MSRETINLNLNPTEIQKMKIPLLSRREIKRLTVDEVFLVAVVFRCPRSHDLDSHDDL